MEQHLHHQDLIQGVYKEFEEIFQGSKQAIYIYLDDEYKVCNDKFASMLGYKSAEEWASIEEMLMDVDKKDRKVLVGAYQDAMDKMIGSTIRLKWNKKGGGTIMTNVIIVPIAHNGHLFALHFISQA